MLSSRLTYINNFITRRQIWSDRALLCLITHLFSVSPQLSFVLIFFPLSFSFSKAKGATALTESATRLSHHRIKRPHTQRRPYWNTERLSPRRNKAPGYTLHGQDMPKNYHPQLLPLSFSLFYPHTSYSCMFFFFCWHCVANSCSSTHGSKNVKRFGSPRLVGFGAEFNQTLIKNILLNIFIRLST